MFYFLYFTFKFFDKFLGTLVLIVFTLFHIWGEEVYATPVFPNVGKQFFCGNWAVVQVVKTGKTKDAFLGACSCNIWLLMATYDIDLQMQHIMGKRISMLMHYLEFTVVSI